MREIKTETTINAPASTIWDILTDFQKFPEWNPFIPHASGKITEGEQLDIHIQPPGSKGMNFKPTVIRVRKDREFRWSGRILIPGIFDGEHIFEIEPLSEETSLFIQRENFKGILVPLLWKSLDKDTRRGFEDMNKALKLKAEEMANSSK